MTEVTRTCVVCGKPFTYEYAGGRKRKFCSDECETARDTHQKAAARQREKEGNDGYPVTLPGTGLSQDELRAMQWASEDAYWGRRRPVSSTDAWSIDDALDADPGDYVSDMLVDELPSDELSRGDDGAAPRPLDVRRSLVIWTGDLTMHDEPVNASQVSEIRERADQYIPLLRDRFKATTHDDDDPMFGLGETLTGLGYGVSTSGGPSEVFGSGSWTTDDNRDKEDAKAPDPINRPLQHEWFDQAGFPAAGFKVGRTGDISTGPGVIDYGAAESLVTTDRISGWHLDEQFEFMPLDVRRAIRCNAGPIRSMPPFVMALTRILEPA